MTTLEDVKVLRPDFKIEERGRWLRASWTHGGHDYELFAPSTEGQVLIDHYYQEILASDALERS